ncbi:MAG: hypothetical protein PVH61_43735 [Candidatus Aminicenantes bacterium]|jgi:hypothetical protein
MQTIAQQFKEEGMEEKAKKTAKNLLEMGIDIDKIAFDSTRNELRWKLKRKIS